MIYRRAQGRRAWDGVNRMEVFFRAYALLAIWTEWLAAMLSVIGSWTVLLGLSAPCRLRKRCARYLIQTASCAFPRGQWGKIDAMNCPQEGMRKEIRRVTG